MNRQEVSDILDDFGLINRYAHIHKGGCWTTQDEIQDSDTRSLVIVEMPTYTSLVYETYSSLSLKTMKVDECSREDILKFIKECNINGFDKIYRDKQINKLLND